MTAPVFVHSEIEELAFDQFVFRDIIVDWNCSEKQRVFDPKRWIEGFDQLQDASKRAAADSLSQLMTEDQVAQALPYLTSAFGEPVVEIARDPIEPRELGRCSIYDYELTEREDYMLPFSISGNVDRDPVGYRPNADEAQICVDYVRKVMRRAGSVEILDESLARAAVEELAAEGVVVSSAFRACEWCGGPDLILPYIHDFDPR